jgi:uncharacterized protein YciI
MNAAMRTVFLVVREPGRTWRHDKPAAEQTHCAEHAAFMETLFARGDVLLGGPLREAPNKSVLVVAAPNRQAVFELLKLDPWTRADVLRVVSVHTWEWTLEAASRAA